MATEWWWEPCCCPSIDDSGSDSSGGMPMRQCTACPGNLAPDVLCVEVPELNEGLNDDPCLDCGALIGTYVMNRLDVFQWPEFCTPLPGFIQHARCVWGILTPGACGITGANLVLAQLIPSLDVAISFALFRECTVPNGPFQNVFNWFGRFPRAQMPANCVFDNFEIPPFFSRDDDCYVADSGLPALLTACGAGDPPPFPPPKRCQDCCGPSGMPAGLVLRIAPDVQIYLTVDFGSFKICAGAVEHAEACKWTGQQIVLPGGSTYKFGVVVLECIGGDIYLTAFVYGHCVSNPDGSFRPSSTSIFQAIRPAGDCHFVAVSMDLIDSDVYPPGTVATLNVL